MDFLLIIWDCRQMCVGSLESLRQQLSENYFYVKDRNRVDIVGIMNTLRVRRSGVRIPAEARDVYPLENPVF